MFCIFIYICRYHMDIQCGYCSYFGSFCAIIDHLYQYHNTQPLKYREKKICPNTGEHLLVSHIMRSQDNANVIPIDINR